MTMPGERRVPPFGREGMVGGFAREHKKGLFALGAGIAIGVGTAIPWAASNVFFATETATGALGNNGEGLNEARDGAAAFISPDGSSNVGNDTTTPGDGETVPDDIASILGGGVSEVPNQPEDQQDGDGVVGSTADTQSFQISEAAGIWPVVRENCGNIDSDSEVVAVIEASGLSNDYQVPAGAVIELACQVAD